MSMELTFLLRQNNYGKRFSPRTEVLRLNERVAYPMHQKMPSQWIKFGVIFGQRNNHA